MKVTRNAVDRLVAEGHTIKQIAALYHCSEWKVAKAKSKEGQFWRESSEGRHPIWPEEIREAKKNCKIGDLIYVFNPWKSGKTEGGEWFGVIEQSRIKAKFPHIVLLENGRSVDYAEIAMQRRNA